MALLKHATREKRELEVLVENGASADVPAVEVDEDENFSKQRKSRAASFGSDGIGSVEIPDELRDAIQKLIAESDKHSLSNDAKRLFSDTIDSDRQNWHTFYNVRYKSREQVEKHQVRDGTAFVAVALPAHFSAIFAVLQHAKNRLGHDWNVADVIDWGSGAGSALWATMLVFQKEAVISNSVNRDLKMSQSSVLSYTGYEKRDGFTSMARRLLKDVDLGNTTLNWQRGIDGAKKLAPSIKANSLAITAFHLSSAPTHQARKDIIKDMWDSGAEVMILLDHGTPDGFKNIAVARELLLKMGKKDAGANDNDGHSCHVVAPCPHDGPCPLDNAHSKKLTCSFSQRMQRPEFVRLTKQVKGGHEDVGYSYVIVRRGQRPAVPAEVAPGLDQNPHYFPDTLSDDQLRASAYSWPRIVFPPLKRSGHIILDSCTADEKIMRITIPKSQGKQPYYDARKSSWGDIFPHPPKNRPQVRLEADLGVSEGAIPRQRNRARPSPQVDNATSVIKPNRHREKKIYQADKSDS